MSHQKLIETTLTPSHRQPTAKTVNSQQSTAKTVISQNSQQSSELPVVFGVHGPEELAEQVFGEDLLDSDFVLLAPGDADPGVVVVGLAGAQGDLLALVLLLESAYIERVSYVRPWRCARRAS